MSLRSVLVATDFTARARLALDRAARLPLDPSGDVLLVHVLRANASERERDEADYQLGLLASAWEGSASLRPLLLEGRPHVELIRAARMHEAEILVFGGQAGERLGKTALRVVRKADRPVLVARVAASRPYRGLLAGLALEDVAAEVVGLARQMIDADAPARRIALHVAATQGFAHRVSEESQRHLREREELRSKEALSSLLGPAADEWEVRIAHGEPTELILRESESRGIELIVVGSHARSGLVHHLLGSVAENVLNRASCDVLVGRPARFAFALP